MHLSVRLTGLIILCLSNHSINCSSNPAPNESSCQILRSSEQHKKQRDYTKEIPANCEEKKQTRVFARPPNIFLIHAVTESCMRVSSAAASKAEGEQKLTATLGSI